MSILTLRAAMADVTPPAGHPLGGYAARAGRVATGVHDPLTAGLVSLTDDAGTTATWLSLDAVAVTTELAAALREAVAEGMDPIGGDVLVCASHTHSGPSGWTGGIHPSDPERRDDSLVKHLADRVRALARRAAQTPEPVQPHWSVVWAPGTGANRNSTDGPHDERAGVLALRSLDGSEVRALLLDHAGHPTALGPENLAWSADWPGAARAVLTAALSEVARFGGGTGRPPVIAFLQGAAGDVSPRAVRRGRGFAEAARLGTLLAGAVLRGLQDRSDPVDGDCRLAVRHGRVHLPGRRLPKADVVRRTVTDAEARRRSVAEPADSAAARSALAGLEGARFQERMCALDLPDRYDAPLTAAALGDIAWLHLPVEPYSAIGLRIAAASPFRDTRVIGCTDGYLSYLVDREAHRAGTYEAMLSLFSPEAGDAMVDAAARLLTSAREATR
ncbi:hypothetical protein [Actinoplanes sp. NPDC089786]|uniref:hypothetical protein n=1 Tax=Actinoplanes sp. NPDC089786 TaxID=3155185 RepID=UPI003446C3B0